MSDRRSRVPQALHASLPPDLDVRVRKAQADWDRAGMTARLFGRDASLWTNGDEARWMGWLDIVAAQRARLGELRAFAAEVRGAGFRHALLLGMGGSSLAPEVLETVFANAAGHPRLHVLDSTDPAQIAAAAAACPPAETLHLVASKSGTTLEPNILERFFFDRATRALGVSETGARFVAITDPGSKLEEAAVSQGFRRIFHGVPEIGGRYSALSDFGLVPAAALGLDLDRFLDRAAAMVETCHGEVSAVNPGVALGLLLGEAARMGRDKVTILTSAPLWDVGAWLEQLLAESTGKQGKGLIPIDGERPGEPGVYGQDRVFVYLRLEGTSDAGLDAAVATLEAAGHPIVHLRHADPYELGGEMFRWEIATAVAGHVLGIDPFDQPDVEASKIATRRLTDEYEAQGALPGEEPFLTDGDIRLYADRRNAEELATGAGANRTLRGALRAHLARLAAGDYFAVLAYVARNEAHRDALQELRHAVRDRRHVATCLGFGPRFLHSTGQAYKGGPNTGVFLQVTCDDAHDLAVPGRKYSFGVVKAAQARGDFAVLAERGRRALRVHLGTDVEAGLQRLRQAIEAATL